VHDLRLALPQTLGEIMRMEESIFSDPWPEWAFRRILASPESLFLRAVLEGRTAGYAVAETDTRGLHVTNLAVAHFARGGGVGRALMEALERWGSRRGHGVSRLEVRETNEDAIAFYRHLGYSVRSRVPGYYNGRCDALLMFRRIQSTAAEKARAELFRALSDRLDAVPRVGVVLGSGLSWLARSYGVSTEVDNADLPGMAGGSLPGHPGKLVVSADGRLVFLMGRRHGYQGYSGDAIALLPGALADLGVGVWVLTSSSGAVAPSLSVGDALLFTDHVNLSGTVCSRPPGRPARCYDPGLREAALGLAGELGAPVREGVFACCSGPEYETAAEIRLLRRMGAATVSMSTAPEALALSAQGCRVLAMSLVTNAADPEGTVSHGEVLDAQELVSRRQGSFLRSLLGSLSGTAS
jgi:purine-nucleoside phosphorylase